MSDFERVAKALDDGVEPEMICSTCPWDRTCIKPPAMTRGEVKAKLDEATKAPAEGDKDKGLMTGLLNIVMFGGKDTQATVCPVFAVRLQSSEGRKIADAVRAMMTTEPVDA